MEAIHRYERFSNERHLDRHPRRQGVLVGVDQGRWSTQCRGADWSYKSIDPGQGGRKYHHQTSTRLGGGADPGGRTSALSHIEFRNGLITRTQIETAMVLMG
jgi:hypothetical protein